MRVALTYDDGPAIWTEPLLDVLADHDAKATFFVLGENIPGREHLIARMAAEGHEIGVHGWDHERITDNYHSTRLRRDLRRVDHQLTLAGAPAPTLWRPPWLVTTEVALKVIRSFGWRYVGIDIDGRDVAPRQDLIVETVQAALYDGAIIGLHDGIATNGKLHVDNREATVAATETLLRGCRSVTVSDLLAVKA